MASKSIQILVNEFPAGGTQTCSLCAQRSYTPLIALSRPCVLCWRCSGLQTRWAHRPKAYVPTHRHPERKRGTSPMKLLSRKKICVTQSPYERSFTSFRMATGAGYPLGFGSAFEIFEEG